MALSRSGLANLIINLVLVTVLVAFGIASLVLWLAGDWENHSWALRLTLKIMWGTWLLLLATVVLTRVTIAGWRFRKLRPGQVPAALARILSEGIQPASLFKSGTASFTITVVMVSLLGVTVLASVLLWIIGDWDRYGGPLGLTMKIIWGTWWVLCVITVLVRIALFNQQRRQALQARANRQAQRAVNSQNGQENPPIPEEGTPTESARGNTP
jgi:hypothetical protein